MRALVETVLAFTVNHGAHIRELRARPAPRTAPARAGRCSGRWTNRGPAPSGSRASPRAARRAGSGTTSACATDRSAPFEKDIPWFNRFTPSLEQTAPRAYLVPQAWREVVERLRWNQVELRRFVRPARLPVEAYRVTAHPVPHRAVRRPPPPRRAHALHRALRGGGANGRLARPGRSAAGALPRRDARASGRGQLLPLGILRQRARRARSTSATTSSRTSPRSSSRRSPGCARSSTRGKPPTPRCSRIRRRCWGSSSTLACATANRSSCACRSSG